MLLTEAYRAILDSKFAKIRGNKLFFVVLDEFQEIANLGDGIGSDKNFVALAREFGGCFLAGTQSLSALTCKVGKSFPVESFASNCNSVLSFYSHDLSTQELMARYDSRIRLNSLNPGQL